MARQHNEKASTPCAAALRLQAGACLRLAESANEYWVAASLRELADVYLDRADRLQRVRLARACSKHERTGAR